MLKSITFVSGADKMKPTNIEKKAGKERDADFKICLKFYSDFFTKKENSESLSLLQNSACADLIKMFTFYNTPQTKFIASLSTLAKEMKGLKSFIFDSSVKSLRYTSVKIIEKAGQERVPEFKISDKRMGRF